MLLIGHYATISDTSPDYAKSDAAAFDDAFACRLRLLLISMPCRFIIRHTPLMFRCQHACRHA